MDARKIFDDEMKEKGCVSVFKEPNEWGRHWNGGDYGCKVMFKLLENGRVLLTYSTTSEFDYCPVWGSFQRCEDCSDYDNDNDECLSPPDVRSYEEAAEIYAAMMES